MRRARALTARRGGVYHAAAMMAWKRQNLHNHSTFSDGAHTPEALVAAAGELRLRWLGLSDHFYTRKVMRKLDYGRWCEEVLDRYLIEKLRPRRHQGWPELVWYGLELDCAFDRIGVPLEKLPWDKLNTLDYLVLEYLGEEERGGAPFSVLPRLRQRFQRPLILGHPDLPLLAGRSSPGHLAEFLNAHQVWLEVVAGDRNPWWYHDDTWWPLLASVPLVLGSDTHDDITQVGAIDRTLAFLEERGLAGQLVVPPSLAGGRDSHGPAGAGPEPFPSPILGTGSRA